MAKDDAIVAAIDGSKESDRALDMACAFAKALARPLVLVTVVPPPPVYPGEALIAVEPVDVTHSFQEALDAADKRARGAGVTPIARELLRGPVAEQLIDFLKRSHPMMAVMGARGLSAGARLFLGSVSDAVVHHAPCPVLVVRSPAKS